MRVERNRFRRGTLLLPGLSCAVLFILTPFLYGDATWKRSLNKNGITIETRPVAGSEYKEFRAVMTAKTTLDKVMAVMQNIPGYTAWMKDCKEAKQIAKLSATSGIVFSVQATPWPIQEREAVVQFTFHKSTKPALISVSMEAVPDAIPVNSGRVRISQLKGYWKFIEVAPGAVEITYSLHSEPGGSLPGWAVSGMVAHLPYQTLNNLRQLLEN